MAEDKKIESNNEVKVTEVKKPQPIVREWVSGRRSWVSMIVLAAVFLGLLCGAYALGKNSDDRAGRSDRFGAPTMMQDRRDYRSGPRGGMMGDGELGPRGGMMGGATNAADSTRVMGVVTAVDGDTVTVSGGGTTTKVVVNDSTTYTGSDKPAKVNDTIMAAGARQSDGSLLASTVRLSRQ
ncbi:MAG: DUF5666 domain-containing protein [Candidatus Saccharimonadales bacterium]